VCVANHSRFGWPAWAACTARWVRLGTPARKRCSPWHVEPKRVRNVWCGYRSGPRSDFKDRPQIQPNPRFPLCRRAGRASATLQQGARLFVQDCPFRIVRTNGPDEVPVRAADLPIGRVGLETAKRTYPKDALECRCGAPLLERSEARQGSRLRAIQTRAIQNPVSLDGSEIPNRPLTADVGGSFFSVLPRVSGCWPLLRYSLLPRSATSV
jgi:hypothetical protein